MVRRFLNWLRSLRGPVPRAAAVVAWLPENLVDWPAARGLVGLSNRLPFYGNPPHSVVLTNVQAEPQRLPDGGRRWKVRANLANVCEEVRRSEPFPYDDADLEKAIRYAFRGATLIPEYTEA